MTSLNSDEIIQLANQNGLKLIYDDMLRASNQKDAVKFIKRCINRYLGEVPQYVEDNILRNVLPNEKDWPNEPSISYRTFCVDDLILSLKYVEFEVD